MSHKLWAVISWISCNDLTHHAHNWHQFVHATWKSRPSSRFAKRRAKMFKTWDVEIDCAEERSHTFYNSQESFVLSKPNVYRRKTALFEWKKNKPAKGLLKITTPNSPKKKDHILIVTPSTPSASPAPRLPDHVLCQVVIDPVNLRPAKHRCHLVVLWTSLWFEPPLSVLNGI